MHEPFALTPGFVARTASFVRWPASRARDTMLDGAVGDLRGLMGEETAHEVRVGAGKVDRGALLPLVEVGDVDAQTSAVGVFLAGDLFVRGHTASTSP